MATNPKNKVSSKPRKQRKEHKRGPLHKKKRDLRAHVADDLMEFMAQARVTRPVHLSLTLRQLVAVIRRARLLISGDTGPLHLAAALGTPVVGLYGPTDPVRNGPYSPPRPWRGRRAVVLYHREQATITYKREDKPSPALLAITVEEVLAAVNRCLPAAGRPGVCQ